MGKNSSIVLKRFNEYHTEPAHLDEIQYKIYSKGQDLLELTDFQQNKIDEMAIYGDRKEKLADKKKLQWFHRPSLSLFFYGMNIKHPNLSDPNFRNALSMAIDREKFVSQVYKGQYEIATTILPPGMPGYSPLNQMEDKNLKLAHELIKKSTINPNETPLELEIVSSFKTPRVEQEIELMKKFWAPLNVSIKAKYITDWKNFVSYLNSDAVQIYRGTWFADMPDPDSFLYSLFASDSPTNFTKLEDINVNLMLSKARGIVDQIERAKFYQKIEADILDLAPIIPLFYMNVNRVYQPYVKNINVSALGAHTMKLNKIWLDKPKAEN